MLAHKSEHDIFNYHYPIVQATVRGKTVTIKREGKRRERISANIEREKIRIFSAKSRSRLALLVLETKMEFKSLLTLTFGDTYPVDGRTTKKLLNRFLCWLRTLGQLDYCWFLEWQKRGAPHIHILLNWQHTHSRHKEMSCGWARANQKELNLSDSDTERIRVQHNRARVWENVRTEEGAKRYVLKYALKTYQKMAPKKYFNVGRFWGASRGVRRAVPPGVELDCDEDELRNWLAARGQVAANWEVLPGVIFRR